MNIEIITTPTETLHETGFGNYSSCQNVLNSIQNTHVFPAPQAELLLTKSI